MIRLWPPQVPNLLTIPLMLHGCLAGSGRQPLLPHEPAGEVSLEPDLDSPDWGPWEEEVLIILPDAGGGRFVEIGPEPAETPVGADLRGGEASGELPPTDPGGPPKAVITIAEGEVVIPQTVLHLSAGESFGGVGKISAWQWSSKQPVGSLSKFIPSAAHPEPIIELNVAGVYQISLKVWDQSGNESGEATAEVVAIPDEAIHIELLWHTPGDPDESDHGPEAGSDMDLHFLHMWAGGPDLDGDGEPDGWFDIPFDCFWFNAHPNWGSYDPAINDDPGLDRDDTDGAGPENINLDMPEDGLYRVGVHYWNDHGYGPSYATIRVYIYAQLVFEAAGVMMNDADLWEVCTVEWPSGQVQAVSGDGGPEKKITPDYHNPYFSQ